MSVHCAYCGEELMGAVNRCWRCGRRFEHAPTPESEPPVRRAPIAGSLQHPPVILSRSGFATAEVVAADVGTETDVADSPATPSAATPLSASESVAAADGSSEPLTGRLRQVEQSTAQRLGSPFDQELRAGILERLRLSARRLLAWFQSLSRDWRLRRRQAHKADPPTARLSPLRTALANAALALSLVLSVVAWCLLHYALIAVVMAILGLTLALVSLIAAPRLRVAAPALACLLLLMTTTYREYSAWQRQQLVRQGLAPAEGLDDEFDE